MKKFLPLLCILLLAILYCTRDSKVLENYLILHCSNYQRVVSNGDSEVYKMRGLDYRSMLGDLNFERVSENVVAGRTIIEGYTPLLDKYVVIGNRKINLQISISEVGDIVLGYPLIESSFWK